MTKSAVLLRIGAIIMLLHDVFHTIGTFGGGRSSEPRIQAVLSAMKSEHFEFMGRSATYARFMEGYGVILIFVMLFIAIQLWQLSLNPSRPSLIAMALLLTAMAISEYVYFFPLAALFSGLSAACVWIVLLRKPTP
jgi:hypothetical protein